MMPFERCKKFIPVQLSHRLTVEPLESLRPQKYDSSIVINGCKGIWEMGLEFKCCQTRLQNFELFVMSLPRHGGSVGPLSCN